MDLFDDTPTYKLSRSDDPETSKQAAQDVSSGKMLQLVYDEVVNSGSNGITTKEIRAIHPDLPYSSITARPAQLEEDGLVYYEGDKRDRCRVMRAKTYDSGFRVCGSCKGVLMAHYDMKCQSPKCGG